MDLFYKRMKKKMIWLDAFKKKQKY